MAETVTTEVVGEKVPIPAGGGAATDGASSLGRRYTAHVSRGFQDVAPEIQDLVRTVTRLYDRASFRDDDGRKILSRFVPNAIWDVPTLYVQGTDRMRVLAKGLAVPFWRVDVTPRLCTVSMVNEYLGRIDVEGVVHFYPRLVWPASAVLPESFPVHVSWSIIARGEDDRIMSVTETLHNFPKLPYPVRATLGTAISTAALAVL